VYLGQPGGKRGADIAPKKNIEKSVFFSFSIRRCITLRKNIIIFVLIISLFTSLFLLIHSRDSPTNMNINTITIGSSQDYRIDINHASREALESLPGIGSVLADRIIKGRPFDDVWELNRIKGIGQKTIEGLEGKIDAN